MQIFKNSPVLMGIITKSNMSLTLNFLAFMFQVKSMIPFEALLECKSCPILLSIVKLIKIITKRNLQRILNSVIISTVKVIFVLIINWLHTNKTLLIIQLKLNLNMSNAVQVLTERLNRMQSKQPSKIPHFT